MTAWRWIAVVLSSVNVAFAQAPPPAEPAPAPAWYAPPPAYQPAPAPHARETSEYRHDGFYMRLGLGYGYMRLARKTSARDALTDEPVAGAEEYDGDSTIQGPGPALDLSFGGTVGNALVLCGTLYAQSTASKTLEREAGADIELGGGLALLLFGFGMHWYPVPTSGFNIGGMLGLGLAGGDTASSSSFTTVGGFGGAVSVDVGYDFWIAEQWSIGATLRATGGSFHGQSSGNLPGGDVVEGREDDVLTGFTLIASVLRH